MPQTKTRPPKRKGKKKSAAETNGNVPEGGKKANGVENGKQSKQNLDDKLKVRRRLLRDHFVVHQSAVGDGLDGKDERAVSSGSRDHCDICAGD